MKKLSFLFAFFLFSSHSYAQLNVTLLHQLIGNSKTEHGKQSDARDRQLAITTGEEVNKTLMAKLKTNYRNIHSRFKTLGLAIDAAQIRIEAYPLIEDIAQSQEAIFRFCKNDPVLSVLAVQAEMDMGERAQGLLNFLYGVAISIGDINQMKQSDRKVLFSHVITELRLIAGSSRGLTTTLQYSSRSKVIKEINPFSDFINTDRALIERILQRTEILKN